MAKNSLRMKMSKDYYYWGRVAADGSPVIINRDLFLQHAHILGNSGSWKVVDETCSLD